MRSRFEAFRHGDAEWLLASWHPSTRPASLDLTQNPRWRGLQIVDTVAGTAADDTGIVIPGSYGHQRYCRSARRSRFDREPAVVLPRVTETVLSPSSGPGAIGGLAARPDRVNPPPVDLS